MCTNQDYTLGDVTTRNQFTRDIPAADPERENDNYYSDLNFGVTEQYLGGGGYDYTNPEGLFYNGGGTPLLDSTYQDIIDGLDGYEGTIIPYYDDGGDTAIRLLDQVELPDTTTMQITYIKIKPKGFAKIKAMELS